MAMANGREIAIRRRRKLEGDSTALDRFRILMDQPPSPKNSDLWSYTQVLRGP